MSDRWSLKVKLPVYVSAMMAAAIAALAIAAYAEVRRSQVVVAHERLGRHAAQLSSLTSIANDARLTTAQAVSSNPVTVGFLTEPDDPDRRAAASELLARVEDGLGAVAYELHDSAGRILVGGPPDGLTASDALTALPDGIGPLHEVDDWLAYPIAAPVVRDGERLGAVVFWREAARLDEQGARALGDLIGPEVRVVIGTPQRGWSDLSGRAVPPPEDAVAAATDPTRADELLRYDRAGTAVYAVAQGVVGSPWVMLVEMPASFVLANARAFLRRLLVLSPLALVMVGLTTWLLGRTITRSLREARVAAEAIAAGRTGQRVPVRSEDELGRLARSFNTMAQQVEDSQAALKETNASLRTMLDGAPLPIIVLDLRGNVRMWNRAAQTSFGWHRRDVVGKPLPMKGVDGQPIEFSESDEGMEGYEVRVHGRQGSPVDLVIARAATYSPSGRIDGQVLVCHDITARKRAEVQLERYAAELARSNSELEDFAYVASHDLREPLRMVRSFTGLLADRYGDALDEEGERYIGFAVNGARRMEDLIRALLDYSRVKGEAGETEETESGPVLADALTLLAPTIREAKASVTHDPLPTVVVDRSQLLRLYQNLIGNAVKFSNGAPPVVHVSAETRGGFSIFCVEDNGIGIESTYHERIFQIFKRLHGPDEFEGTGIGLSICKKIVERHGGSIWVESSPGEGSRFYFSLPTVPAAAT